MKLLLTFNVACTLTGVKLPWEKIAEIMRQGMDPERAEWFTPSSITQHIEKLRQQNLKLGRNVPLNPRARGPQGGREGVHGLRKGDSMKCEETAQTLRTAPKKRRMSKKAQQEEQRARIGIFGMGPNGEYEEDDQDALYSSAVDYDDDESADFYPFMTPTPTCTNYDGNYGRVERYDPSPPVVPYSRHEPGLQTRLGYEIVKAAPATSLAQRLRNIPSSKRPSFLARVPPMAGASPLPSIGPGAPGFSPTDNNFPSWTPSDVPIASAFPSPPVTTGGGQEYSISGVSPGGNDNGVFSLGLQPQTWGDGNRTDGDIDIMTKTGMEDQLRANLHGQHLVNARDFTLFHCPWKSSEPDAIAIISIPTSVSPGFGAFVEGNQSSQSGTLTLSLDAEPLPIHRQGQRQCQGQEEDSYPVHDSASEINELNPLPLQNHKGNFMLHGTNLSTIITDKAYLDFPSLPEDLESGTMPGNGELADVGKIDTINPAIISIRSSPFMEISTQSDVGMDNCLSQWTVDDDFKVALG